MRATDLDRQTLEAAAREAFERPADAAFWDDRCYATHVPVYGWADRGDDILTESNFHAFLAALKGVVAHDESGASEARGDDVYDASASHWLVGSLQQIWVRVYVSDDWEDQEPDAREFTPAFAEAVSIATGLREQYPILDESDYSEREYERWEELVDQAIHDAARDHYEDSDAECQAFYTLLTYHDFYRDRLYDQCGYPDPDWDEVAKLYAEVRNEHFDWLARRELAVRHAPMAGQLAMW